MKKEEKAVRENPWLTGMTLRDVMAAQILSGQIASGTWSWTADQTSQALNVWALADIMISTRG